MNTTTADTIRIPTQEVISTDCFGKPVVRAVPDLIPFKGGRSALAVGPQALLRHEHAKSIDQVRSMAVPITCGWSYVVSKLGGCRQMSFEDTLDGLHRMARLGFHFVEVEGFGRIGANLLYERREELRERLEEWGLQVLVYSFADHTFLHTDFRNQARYALERFQEKALPTARGLGAEMIRVNSFTPSQVFYVDPKQDSADPDYYRWPPYNDEDLLTSQVKLPENFKMKAAWNALVAGCKIAAELARRQGLPLTLRAHRREFCENTSDLINLCNDIEFSNFYLALDTSLMNFTEEFLYAARKAVELARPAGRVLQIYAADNDGRKLEQGVLRAYDGRGGIDWDQFAQLLKEPLFRNGEPFRGPFVLEVGGTELSEIDNRLIASAHQVQSLFTSHEIPWLI